MVLVDMLLLFDEPHPIDPIVVEVTVSALFVWVIVEELRIARLTDKLNSVENKPRGKMRFW